MKPAFAVIIVVGQLAAASAWGIDEVSEPFVGVQHVRRRVLEPVEVSIDIVIIDLKAEGIGFRVTEPDTSSANDARARTVRTFLRQQNAQIVINSGFFYWAEDHWHVMGFTASDRNAYSPFASWYGFPDEVSLNIDQRNNATVIYPCPGTMGWSACPWGVSVYNALPGSEWIVRDGQVDVDPGYHLNPPRHPRTGAGVTADDQLVLVVVDGRNPGHSLGMTTVELAEVMIEFGVVDGINLDGGGSTTLAMAELYPEYPRLVNVPVGQGNQPYTERVMPNHLAIFARPKLVDEDILVLADFENNYAGTFAYSPGYSGSTWGIRAQDSAADVVHGPARGGQWSQRLVIADDDSVDGWFVRHVSGSAASAGQNVGRQVSGYAGLWAMTEAEGVEISLSIENEGQKERGVPVEMAADGRWHLYQWDLEDDQQWQGWFNGDGQLADTEFTLDSVQLFGAGGDAVVYIDDISHNRLGRLDEFSDCRQVWQLGFGIEADFNRDCVVDVEDLAMFAQAWLTKSAGFGLYEQDSAVDFRDFAVFAQNWHLSQVD